MRVLEIPFIAENFPQDRENLLKSNFPEAHFKIDNATWKEYSYVPQVNGEISAFNDGILLRYSVRERYTRARFTKDNSPVYKDSCVEFFLSIDRKNYFNFEFNCIGCMLLQYGESRQNRRFAGTEALERIVRYSTLGKNQFEEIEGDIKWKLGIFIPFSVIEDLSGIPVFQNGRELWGNFYKCGDELTLPHYVTWNRVETAEPDFHRPEYFGKLVFE